MSTKQTVFQRPQAATLAGRLGQEVDFIARARNRLVAIEVKSGRAPQAHAGTAAFAAAFKVRRSLLVGGDGIPVEDFLTQPVAHWVMD